MKKLILIALLTMSSQVFSAEILIKLARIPGFTPNPVASDLTINDRGQITYRVADKKGTTTTKLGALSDTAIQNLKDKIELIPDNAKLERLDNGPRCMDAPAMRIMVVKGGKEIIIASKVSCQRSAVTGTDDLAQIVLGLENLAK